MYRRKENKCFGEHHRTRSKENNAAGHEILWEWPHKVEWKHLRFANVPSSYCLAAHTMNSSLCHNFPINHLFLFSLFVGCFFWKCKCEKRKSNLTQTNVSSVIKSLFCSLAYLFIQIKIIFSLVRADFWPSLWLVLKRMSHTMGSCILVSILAQGSDELGTVGIQLVQLHRQISFSFAAEDLRLVGFLNCRGHNSNFRVVQVETVQKISRACRPLSRQTSESLYKKAENELLIFVLFPCTASLLSHLLIPPWCCHAKV